MRETSPDTNVFLDDFPHEDGPTVSSILIYSVPTCSHFGFIENYRDPAGGRSSFEGIAAVVTIEKTNLLSKVVTNAPRLIESFLPWPKGFEKDLFLAPDFTSLDAIAHSGHAIYSGVNLPNCESPTRGKGFVDNHRLEIQ